MCGVRRPRPPDAQAHLEIVLIDDAAEAVAAYRTVEAEFFLIHVPQLHPAETGIVLTYVSDVLEGELLACGFGMSRVPVILVISLLAYTKQFAETLDAVASRDFCVQVSYCLAPAFFRIGTLNLASATSIILS